jgi:hypothetical protein
MERNGVISRVEEPTEWCAPMVVVRKDNGKYRVCVDLTKLNEFVLRESHPLPTTDTTLGKHARAKFLATQTLREIKTSNYIHHTFGTLLL